MTGAKYFLVKNFINNTSFFEWDQATYNSYFHRIKDAVEITIPKLNEMAYEQVEGVVGAVPEMSSPTRASTTSPRIIRSCCAAMSGIGSPMSGANSTASS